ncbi:glycoside hydrolase family 92 protein [Dothistroma septosporum NZE10]|uniref:Glycoside hydrolase family 92 protein n=1 Tax=Dothistroma septosporum (strain NZE10 / CBS 128990) TaxID=675120 RepID=N1PC12_DOTSN|nr:glycoside hydrolase family 92 protein [Dothistroma septosporum NZE10]
MLGSLLLAGFVHGINAQSRLSNYVDPLIGTEGAIAGSAIGGGNSFPGASLPWGMAKPGIDTSFLGLPNATDCNAGYSPLGNVTAVSMMHVSGTGGAPTYGTVAQMPLFGNLVDVNLADNNTYAQNRSLELETASVGNFTTVLVNGVKIEITAGKHSGILRYTYPSSSRGESNNLTSSQTYVSGDALQPAAPRPEDAHVLVDLTHILPSYSIEDYSQKFLRGDLHVRSGENEAPSYHGSAMYSGGWPQIESQTIYFCANFTASNGLVPTDAYVEQQTLNAVAGAGTFNWFYDPVVPLSFTLRPYPLSAQDAVAYIGGGQGIGALFSWTRSGSNSSEESVIESRIGISYISAAQACSNLQAELPCSVSFGDAVEAATQEWETRVLSHVEVMDDGSDSSSNDTLKRMLYTALYQTGLSPTDKTGENPYWHTDDKDPYYDDFYTLWDTYRTVMPLYHLLFTNTYSRVLGGLVSIFKHEGFLPAGRSGNWNGRVQGGTHADMVLSDAFVKDVVTLQHQQGDKILNVSWNDAYAAVLKDATTLPIRNVDPVAFDGATKEGRGALDEQLRLGFITRNRSRSISRGLEYAQNDFAIYSMASGLDRTEDIDSFRNRSGWWQNQWNPFANATLPGAGTFTGFPGARNSDGSWNYSSYDPVTCDNCGWGGDIYEATVWETAFSAAPHDMAKVISLMGGDDNFIKRLETSFIPGLGKPSDNANNDAGTAIFNPGNEPSFMTPWLYNYVPKNQWRTVNQTRAIIDQFYDDTRNGYPGNTDSGALPSWLVWNLIGLYPVAAQPIYLVGAPRFSSLKLRLFAGTIKETELSIQAKGLAYDRYYPQAVTLNGKRLDRSWISHEELSKGGTLSFEMGSEPGNWDSGARPPSLSPWPA